MLIPFEIIHTIVPTHHGHAYDVLSESEIFHIFGTIFVLSDIHTHILKTCTHAYILHTQAFMSAYILKYICMHAYLYINTYLSSITFVHAFKHTYACIHTYICDINDTYEVTGNYNNHIYSSQTALYHTVVFPEKYGYNIAHTCPTALLLQSTCTPCITVHITQKQQQQHLFHSLLPYMFQLQKWPSNAIRMPHTQIN